MGMLTLVLSVSRPEKPVDFKASEQVSLMDASFPWALSS